MRENRPGVRVRRGGLGGAVCRMLPFVAVVVVFVASPFLVCLRSWTVLPSVCPLLPAPFSCPYAYPRTCQCAWWCAGRHSPSVRFVHTPPRPTVVPPFVARSSFVVRPASASAHAHRIYNHTSHIRFSAPLPPAFACAALLPVVVCPQPPSLLFLPLTICDPLLTTASSRALSLIFILSLSDSRCFSLSRAHYTFPPLHASHVPLGSFANFGYLVWLAPWSLVWSGPVGRSCVRACGSFLPPLSRSSPCVTLVPMTLPPSLLPPFSHTPAFAPSRCALLRTAVHARPPGGPPDALSHGQ